MGDAGDVGRPDLVGPIDQQPPQQVGMHHMLWMAFGGVLAPLEGLDAHLAHQRAHMQPNT